jgi:hypothetical protein
MKIYTEVEPVPSRVVALARLLLSEGDLPETQLISLLQPRENKNMASKTLDAAIEIGLVEHRLGKYRLTEILPKTTKPSQLDKQLPIIMARLLMRQEIDRKPNGFVKLCAWILLQPILTFPHDRSGIHYAMKAQGLPPDELQVANEARLDNVIYWARYLGLVRQMEGSIAAGVIPDPTDYLRRFLPEILPLGEEVTAQDFRSRLAQLCPALDGGAVREALLQKLDPDWPANRLSESLAFAIERLQHSKEVQAWCPDDWRDFLLTPDGTKIAFLKRTK